MTASVVSAAHTTNASLNPEWSPADADVDYTVTFCKNSGDTVNEVRIYKDYDGSAFYTDFECDDKPGWEKLFINSYPACFYVADESSDDYNPLDTDGECEDFTFSAHSPGPDFCDLSWRFETRDTQDFWQYLYDNTSVDDEAPILEKDIIGAQSGSCPPDEGEECWVRQSTKIKVMVEEQGICGISGLDFCEITYTLDGGSQQQETYADLDGELEWEYEVYFGEDSVHDLNVTCVDIAGNKLEDVETFRVDDTAPDTNKIVSEPKKINADGVEWVDGVTNITLESEDGGDICAIGNEKTYFINTLDETKDSCLNQDSICQPLSDEWEVLECEHWDCLKNGDEKDFMVTGRSDDTDWDLAIGMPDTGSSATTAASLEELPWVNGGDPVPFIVEYDAETGMVTYTVDGETITAKYDEGKAFEYLVIMAKGNNGGDMHLTNVKVNGEGISDVISSANYEGRQVYLGDKYQVSGFTVTGYAYMEWSSKTTQEVPGFHVIAMENHDNMWEEYTGVIQKNQESCHNLHYFSVDELGNFEDTQVNCFFVDKTPPKEMKAIKDPKEPLCGERDLEEDWKVYNVNEKDGDVYDVEDYPGIYDGPLHVKTITHTDGTVEFIAEVPVAFVDGSQDNVAFPFDSDNDGLADFQLSYHANQNSHYSGEHWGYREVTPSDAWSEWQEVPNEFTVSETGNQEFSVLFSSDELGGCGSSYRFGVAGSYAGTGTNGGINSGENVYFQFPKNFSWGPNWIESEDYYLTYVGALQDWWLNGDSRVALDCQDQGPHPSEGEEACYRVSFDDPATPDLTAAYCGTELDNNNQNPGYMDEDWCCADVHGGLAYWITFQEESLHGLEYFCRDAVDKKTEIDLEYFRVDMTPPEITKTMLGDENVDWMGTCPPESESDECYVLGGSGVHVDVADPDTTGEGCAIDNVVCNYTVEWEGSIIDEGTFGEEGVDIIFDKDSAHTLTINCEDLLGNKMDEDVETFLVDMNPPVTSKTYDESMSVVKGDYRWITVDTDITLMADDEKIGVEGIHYMNEWVSNETCEAHPAVPSETSGYQYPVSSGNHVFPSTNEENKEGTNTYRPGVVGPHVNVVDTGVGEVTLDFVNPLNYEACFEYMTDADTSQATGDPNDHPDVADLYPHVCLTDGTQEMTLSADMFAEVRLVFGAERDWDFDWTRFDVIPDTSEWSYVADDTVTFNILEESCHIIQYFAEDEFGNVEDVQRQYVIVDDSAPEMDKVIGEPYVNKSGKDYITQNTPISLSCWDAEPHPVGDVTLEYRYRVADDCDDLSTVEWGDQWTVAGNTVTASSGDMAFSSTGWGGWSCPEGTVVVDGGYEPADHTVLHSLAWEPGACVDDVCWPETPFGHTYSEGETGWIVQNGGEPQSLEVYAICADPFTFSNDSCHELEYRCTDGLGIMSESEFEIDVVDTKAPNITTDIEGPNITVEGDVFIDGVTNITVDAFDPEPHPVGGVECKFEYDVVDDNKTGLDEEGEYMSVPFKVNFPEESEHLLKVTCKDELGNKASLEETYFVDKTAPGIEKDYGLPYYQEDFQDFGAEWISTSTPIYGHIEDEGPHKSGIAQVEYRVTQLDNDEYCRHYNNGDGYEGNDFDCDNAVGSGDWTVVPSEEYDNFTFGVDEESCHLIEIRARDNVEKESLHKQCVFVDDTAPEPNKTIGEPKAPMSSEDLETGETYYPGLGDVCAESENPEKCMEVTLLTDIDLACNDLGPHPSGSEAVYFKVGWDGDDETIRYCDVLGGNYQGEEDEYAGYCYLAGDSGSFHFLNESWHRLEYFCEDNVGNVGDVTDVEYFKVRGHPFRISLDKKWNLISVPVMLQQDDIEDVFAGKDEVAAVWTYNGSEWFVYTPEDDGPDSLHSMVPGNGYWVLTTGPTEITIGGSLMREGNNVPPTKGVVYGWNLIGYYGIDGAPWLDESENEVSPLTPGAIPVYEGPDLSGHGNHAWCELGTLRDSVLDRSTPSLFAYGSSFMPLSEWAFMNPGAGYWMFYSGEEPALYTKPTMGCPMIGPI